MKKNFNEPSGSRRKNEPRVEKLFINTDLCIDLKTLLRHDSIVMIGKRYLGMLKRDGENHYTFQEMPSIYSLVKRNPRVYMGSYITVTRRDDGSLRLNFRPVRMELDFNVASYATEVANEILWALTSLLGK